jgi:predicted MPP superfamily phosphohydrolase
MRRSMTARRLNLLFLNIFALGLSVAPGQEKLSKGPVIQNVQTDRATINWVTTRAVGELRKEGADISTPVDEPFYHQVELTGLEPGTAYHYDLRKYGIDALVSFTTAPLGDKPYSFIVFGDTRTRHDVHRRVVEHILAEKPQFVINTGDLVSNGLNPSDWDRFFEIEKDLLRRAAYYPVLGNHERDAPVFSRYFTFPGGNSYHYSFDWGSAHFVGLDSDQFLSPQFAEMQDWLQADLKRTKKPLVFVYFHHPLYSAVEKRTDSAARLAEKLEPILLAGGVTAVFNGHDHNYQHHVKDGLHHIVTGGGGAPLYDVVPIPGLTVKVAKTENYVRLHVEGVTAHVEAVDIQGNTLDSFDLVPRKK